MRIGICEDSRVMLSCLKTMIQKESSHIFGECKISTFTNGVLLLRANKQSHFDIVFLDIAIPEMDGFEIARLLREEERRICIIFVSSKEELVFDSFQFQPFSFIRKNRTEQMEKEIAKVLMRLADSFIQDTIIEIPQKFGAVKRVKCEAIQYIFSDRNYLNYCIGEKEPVRTRGNLKLQEKELENKGFVRISKRVIISMKHLKTIELDRVIVDKETLQIGRDYRQKLGERYAKYLQMEGCHY